MKESRKYSDVLVLSHAYKPEVGGLVTYVSAFGKTAKALGFNVNLLVMTKDKDLDGRRVFDEGVDVTYFYARPRGLLKLFAGPFIHYKAKIALNRFLSESGRLSACTRVLTRHFAMASAASSLPACKGRVTFIIPLIAPRLFLLELRSSSLPRSVYCLLQVFFSYLMELYAIKHADKIGVLSKSKAKEVKSYYGTKEWPEVFQCGVDTSRFRPPSNVDERRSLLTMLGREVDTSKSIVLTVCRLTPEKNVDFLLSVISKVKCDNTVFYIVGAGECETALQSRVKLEPLLQERVVFWGLRQDVECFYRVASVFVLPSVYEGFGHVFLEAMASSLPIIGLRSDPPRVITATDEIVNNGENGFSVDFSVEAMAAAIEFLLQDEKKRIQMGACGRRDVLEKWSFERHVMEVMSGR